MATIDLSIPKVSIIRLCAVGFLLAASIFAGARVGVMLTVDVPAQGPQEYIVKFDPDLTWPDYQRVIEGRRRTALET